MQSIAFPSEVNFCAGNDEALFAGKILLRIKATAQETGAQKTVEGITANKRAGIKANNRAELT